MSDEFYFDDAAADRAEQFFPDMLTHVKGPLAKTHEPFRLEQWQRNLVRNVFGWKRTADDLRKFRTVYCEVPRKNGKTTFAAGVLLYMLFCDHEPGAEVFSAASTRDQASIVYQIATAMIDRNAHLRKACTVRKSGKRVNVGDSFYQACSSDAGAPHGTSPHCLIFDEVHLQKTRDLWEAFQTGLGARDQPLIFAITTAGHDRSSLCWELHQYSKGVRDGEIQDETFLPVLFGADMQDDWRDEATWAKANPCLDVSLKRDYIRQQCLKAQENAAEENSFRRLHLNQWTEQEVRFVPMKRWDDCRTDFAEADMIGRPCFAAMDLASTRDVTALVLVFPDDDGGYHVLPYFWIPEDNVDRRAASDRRQVLSYAKQGHITMTSGNVLDVFQLCHDVFDILQRFGCEFVGFDPWQADSIAQMLESKGMPPHAMVKMSQGVSTYNEPMKRMLELLAAGKLRHNGNTVLRWMAGNLAHKEDPNGNYRPDKGKSQDKIDGMSALLMALRLAFDNEHAGSAYDTEGAGVVLL